MANVLVQESSLTAIADAIREKNGETTAYKPAEMADAIAAIPSGGSLDFLTNTTDYGTTVYDSGSNVTSSLALPDDVAFEDIVFIMGHGGVLNSSVSVSGSARHNLYIYCPALYDKVLDDTHACFGSICGNYSSTYYQGIDIGSAGYGRPPSGGNKYYPWIKYDATNHAILFYTGDYQSSSDETITLTKGYAIAKYGYVAVIYKKKG